MNLMPQTMLVMAKRLNLMRSGRRRVGNEFAIQKTRTSNLYLALSGLTIAALPYHLDIVGMWGEGGVAALSSIAGDVHLSMVVKQVDNRDMHGLLIKFTSMRFWDGNGGGFGYGVQVRAYFLSTTDFVQGTLDCECVDASDVAGLVVAGDDPAFNESIAQLLYSTSPRFRPPRGFTGISFGNFGTGGLHSCRGGAPSFGSPATHDYHLQGSRVNVGPSTYVYCSLDVEGLDV